MAHPKATSKAVLTDESPVTCFVRTPLGNGPEKKYRNDNYIIRYCDIPAFVVDSGIRLNADMEIYDENDDLILSSYGPFLNTITPEHRERFMDEIVSYQLGEKEIPEVDPLEIL